MTDKEMYDAIVNLMKNHPVRYEPIQLVLPSQKAIEAVENAMKRYIEQEFNIKPEKEEKTPPFIQQTMNPLIKACMGVYIK